MLLATTAGALALCGCQQHADNAASTSDAAAPAAVTPGLPSAPQPVAAPAGPALGQAVDAKGELRMDVAEAVRSGGVLTIKTRFTLVTGKVGSRALPGAMTADVYATAADKKYLLLKDDHDKALMSSNSYPSFDQMGVSEAWWGKFPAPPAEVKAINFYFAGFEPVENVAIADR